jgi:hypothetical protein
MIFQEGLLFVLSSLFCLFVLTFCDYERSGNKDLDYIENWKPLLPEEFPSPTSLPLLISREENPYISKDTLASPTENDKRIPKLIWVAITNANEGVPDHLKNFFKRNLEWTPQVCDNQCKDHFMESFFGNTSILQVYKLVRLGAFKADIWRYAVLYAYGGVYLDDDSDIKLPLNDIIGKDDMLLMSEEGPSSLGPCYIPEFHLSDDFTLKFLKENISLPEIKRYISYDEKDSTKPIFFHGNTLINWAIMVAPRHPLFLKTLENVCDIIKSEYIHKSVLQMSKWDQRHKIGLCSTMFAMTYTLRELLLSGNLRNDELPKISTRDFHEYGGKCKAIWTGNDPNHYSKKMKQNAKLLNSYSKISISEIIADLHGKLITSEGKSKSIYYVVNNTKHEFGDYNTFLELGFGETFVKPVKDGVLERLANGRRMTKDLLV